MIGRHHNIRRLSTATCVAVAASAILALGDPSGGRAQEQSFANKSVTTPARAQHAVTVSPGRVTFTSTPAGRWTSFGPTGAPSLIHDGGFVVTAHDASGGVVTIADTRRGLDPAPGIAGVTEVKEGVPGGARYPSTSADDDGDGLVDEDPLDGVDNDGDGKVDEDFAAIGDAMAVAGCVTHAGNAAPAVDGQPGTSCEVTLHQECYAWSLSHIDGMVAMKLTVHNTGDRAIDGVRVGAVIDGNGNARVATRTLDSGTDAFTFDRPLSAKAMTLASDGWPTLGLVFASNRHGETSWLTGEVRSGGSIADVVRAADRPDAIARPDRPRPAFEPPPPPADTAPATSGYTAYGISPVLGTLEPGDEVEVYVALVALDDTESADRIIDDAYRTIEGDNGHRLIPPPVSITRRTLWGTYTLRVPGEAEAGVTLTIANPRAQGIDPTAIARLQGIDLRGATRTVTPSGDVVFEVTGDVPHEIDESQRVVLGGQTREGRAFNAVLRPTVTHGEVEAAAEAATRYWNTSGKLDDALLTNSPNPFRIATTISYEVPSTLTDENGVEFHFDGQVDTSVKVYNVAGRLVSTLIDTREGPGRYQTQWNASNASGGSVASGVYYVKLQIGKRFITKRLIQLK